MRDVIIIVRLSDWKYWAGNRWTGEIEEARYYHHPHLALIMAQWLQTLGDAAITRSLTREARRAAK